ncbi:ABC transporter permease [Patulibacter minatonensis]|uniref:ABC transporter permease n=1 Tax=Patulibacter minatonensis TaxID=298163 RepID=UPI00055BD7A1|nr:ABC transporter permease [Patulibacter minatonensis]
MSTPITADPGQPPVVPLTDDDAASADVARSQRQILWGRLKRDKVALVSLGLIGVLVLVAILAPLLVQVLGLPSPDFQDGQAVNEGGEPLGPNSINPFGVDQLGRDVASRVIYGARVSLSVALLSTAISVTLGTLVGVLAGYFRGWVDAIVSRLLDVLLAFPILMLGIGLASACSIGSGCLGGLITPGVPVVVIIIAIAGFPFIARIVRGQVLSLREEEFVLAARSIGASHTRIMLRHLVPNLVAPIIVYSTVLVPQNILFEASLSFLGVGVQDPTSSWGQMLGDASKNTDQWWFMLFPGLALLLTVLAFNLLGDGLQDALNPRKRR